MVPSVLAFIAYAICLSGQLADSVTTESALAFGGKETNKISAWIVAKLGVTGLTILKCVVVPAIGIPFFIYGGWISFAIYEIPLGIVGWVCGVINARRNRAAGHPAF
jgi:hypothetical protein